MSLIGLLVVLILIGLVFWAVKMLAGAFGLPAPVVTVIYVVLVVLVILYLLRALGLTSAGPTIQL